MYYYNDWFPFQVLGPVLMLLFWILVIYAVWRFVTGGGVGHRFNHHNDSAMRILKERYAKGEITREQFESMKRDIQ